ncbi:hypothetical protein B566_EDAN000702 [Ephemera danica]|nr:hypothetical protein B566_EDAN000702 [Ephemera danica]
MFSRTPSLPPHITPDRGAPADTACLPSEASHLPHYVRYQLGIGAPGCDVSQFYRPIDSVAVAVAALAASDERAAAATAASAARATLWLEGSSSIYSRQYSHAWSPPCSSLLRADDARRITTSSSTSLYLCVLRPSLSSPPPGCDLGAPLPPTLQPQPPQPLQPHPPWVARKSRSQESPTNGTVRPARCDVIGDVITGHCLPMMMT